MANAALYLFLSATVVAVLTFTSVAVWIGARSQERRSRDRSTLLRSIAEQPSENARLVLELLREQDARKAYQAREQERRGTLQGGLILIAIGVALAIMMAAMAPNSGGWSVGLIPLLIGVVLCVSVRFLLGPGGPSGRDVNRPDL
jgi:hypothetical protein